MSYLEPLLLLLILALAVFTAALVRSPGVPRGLRRASVALTLLVFLVSWPPVARLSVSTLEAGYLKPKPLPPADAIVLLSGGIYPANPSLPGALPAFGTYLRIRCAGGIHALYPTLPIVASGGIVTAGPGMRPLADIMTADLRALGVPPELLITEKQSRSTYENAVFTAEILLPRGLRRIILVSEGYHLPRSVRTFRHAGFTEVYPAPCSLRMFDFGWGIWETYIPSYKAIRVHEEVLHEWVATIWYWISGKLSLV